MSTKHVTVDLSDYRRDAPSFTLALDVATDGGEIDALRAVQAQARESNVVLSDWEARQIVRDHQE